MPATKRFEGMARSYNMSLPVGEGHEQRKNQSSRGFSWEHKLPSMVFRINQLLKGLAMNSQEVIDTAKALASYAALCRKAGLVPIGDREVLMEVTVA
jgi:Fructose-bisphosphate aldolase class-I